LLQTLCHNTKVSHSIWFSQLNLSLNFSLNHKSTWEQSL
jgi:hypothetical protein